MIATEDMMRRFSPEFLKNEKPLEYIPADGGMVGVLRTIGCVGDSLSSGEFESTNLEGGKGYHDYFDYSWGQYMARMAGVTVRNFSRGGMTAREYCETFASQNDFWNPELACSAYIIALGLNDLFGRKMDVGTMADVHEDWTRNERTFAGYYGQLISRLKQIRPDAKFFLMTIPRDSEEPERVRLCDEHAKLLHAMAARFENTYVLDLRAHAPVYDKAFHENFFLGGHMNAAGCIFDGFPRTTVQAEEFDKILAGHGLKVDVMIDIHVPEEELVRRILLRGKDSGRADDASEDVIRNRIKVYREQTEVVGAYYARQNKYFEVDGVGSMDEVFDRICRVVDAHR